MSTHTLEQEVIRVPVKPDAQTRDEPQQQPPYVVILHNDDLNGFDHVVRSLTKVCHLAAAKAFLCTVEAHTRGRSTVWSGMKEHAELKAEQLVSCGPDPDAIDKGALPLRVTVEPLPQ